jgi:molecular chaperone GrpE (heat shock protein)
MGIMNDSKTEESKTDLPFINITDSSELHVEDQENTVLTLKNSIENDLDDSDNISNSNDENEISYKLDHILSQLETLQGEFLSKLKNDAHKDKLIDLLHQEVQSYKSDLIKKHVQSMAVDVIKIIDDIRRISEHYKSIPPKKLDPQKLLHLLTRIPGDLEDIFFYQGVKPFFCSGNEFDATRQRVLKRVATTNASLDNKVAKSLKPGYELDNRVIRPEIVAVYLYEKLSEEQEMEFYDE